jgi:hypothetical protein
MESIVTAGRCPVNLPCQGVPCIENGRAAIDYRNARRSAILHCPSAIW